MIKNGARLLGRSFPKSKFKNGSCNVGGKRPNKRGFSTNQGSNKEHPSKVHLDFSKSEDGRFNFKCTLENLPPNVLMKGDIHTIYIVY